MAAKRLVMKSRVPFTRKDGFRAAARQIERAMVAIDCAKAAAPPGELANLPDLSPWLEAMQRAEAGEAIGGPVYYPGLRLD